MTLVAVAPNKFARGFDGSGRKTAFAYEPLELVDALTRTYPSDAHLVTYVVEGATTQPRINKVGLPHFDERVTVGVFFCDVDNPAHAVWDDALLQSAIAQYDSLPVLATAGIYHTAHGRRIVQPIAEPIAVQQAEPHLRRWLMKLEQAGLSVDWACRDWTRHFRLPNVHRKGCDYRSPFIRLDQMRPVTLEPLPAIVEVPSALPAAAPGPVPVVEWTADLPEVWRPRIPPVAEAVRRVTSEWHTLFMAIAGALISRRVPHEHVPVICRAISLATNCDTRTVDRENSARSTVQRHLAGHPTTGYSTLVVTWPAVAYALDAALASGNEAYLRAQAAADPAAKPQTVAETTAALEDAIRRAPDGLTLISAACGLGKTRAAVKVASERAAKPYASSDASGERAPPQSKTAISVDKHALALQIAEDLRTQGTAVRRLFGPLSLRNPDGTPVCRYHAAARPLVEGGQAMQWEFCEGRGKEPCEFRATCAARMGCEGPEDARVTVGPHALLNELDSSAGSTGLLVIDEPPPLLETTLITVDDLDTALRHLRHFESRYAAAMKPALKALWEWLAIETQPTATPLQAAIRTYASAVHPSDLDHARFATCAPGDLVDCVSAAQDPGREARPPPLRFAVVRKAQRNADFAEDLGVASKVLGTIYRGVRSTIQVAARIETRSSGRRALLVTSASEQLSKALQREGAVVVTDANAELHVSVMAKVVGYTPRLHRFLAADGAPIARTLLRCTSATRKRWLPGGHFAVDGSFVAALRLALDWAREDAAARKLGIITMRTIELALKAALRPDDEDVEHEWRAAGQSAKALSLTRSTLGPLLRSWPGEIHLAHYGAVRGLNDFADMDCLITLGDPWPNLGDVRNDVAFLGLEGSWEARLEDLCRAELEQAHGRLRTVHRTRQGRALHVGNVLPSGSGWGAGPVEVRRLEGGRPQNESSAEPAEVKAMVEVLGGPSATVSQLGCSSRALRNYQSGARKVPAKLEARLHKLVAKAQARLQSGTKPPTRSISDQVRGFVPL